MEEKELNIDFGNKELGSIYINGEKYTKPKYWIDCFKELSYLVPLELTNKIMEQLDFVPYKPYGMSRDLPIMPIFKEKVSVRIGTKDYYVCPMYPDLCVSTSSEIMRRYYNGLKPYYQQVKVLRRRYLSIDRDDKYIHAHKIVALTFCKNDDYVLKNTIDHINGNKDDYNYKNLRWASASHNQTYSIYDHKTDKIRPTFTIKNADNDKKLQLWSVNDIQETLKTGQIRYPETCLEQGKLWVTKTGRWEVYFTSKFRYWTFTKKNRPPENIKVERWFCPTFYVKDFISGHIMEFHSIKSCRKKLGLEERSVKMRLIGPYIDAPLKNYIISFNREGPWADEKPGFDPMASLTHVPVKATIFSPNVARVVEKVFESIKDAHRALNISERKIKQMLEDNTHYLFNNLVYKFTKATIEDMRQQ